MSQSLANLSYSPHLLDEKSRTVADDQRSTAERTRLFGGGIERPKVPSRYRRRHRQPRSYSLPAGENGICFESHGASESVFLKMVKDTGKPYVCLATWLWGFLSKPIAGRFSCGLHPEPRRASSDHHVRGGILFISQRLPGGLRRAVRLGLARRFISRFQRWSVFFAPFLGLRKASALGYLESRLRRLLLPNAQREIQHRN